ncbi:LytTR family DNA-binding domain-containing protein [Pleionea sp. CnH1-48]|uniref:LytR/AlgR family response regulator transcription factor n=1 Tax=Pleionea sp. CnH1-48 TaxID=2954494 RepID=UPI0020973C19|nr:LytTR family DNA-binding domain-containing protein [Pleionea sp. CnH1-48]MCO7223152.1 LytTR family DNA-binding domain-containing protein [Pleionea sp. CnH1-48]
MMNKIQCVIVDDEPLARLNVRESLSRFEHWNIVAEFESGEGVEEIIKTNHIDVIFLDIQMPGQDGLSLAKRLFNMESRPLIVFITAFDNYALQAFELYAIDYLLKPFDNERFKNSIERAEKQVANAKTSEQLHNQQQQYFDKSISLDRLVIRSTGSIRIIQVADILWLASEGNYVQVHHSEGCHLHRVSLSFMEKHLGSDVFYRVHRKAIVRLSEVRELKTLADGKYQLILSNGDHVNVSKSYKDGLLDKLGA